MTTEFRVGEHDYRTDKRLDVFMQNNILRRLLPALGGVAKALMTGEQPAPSASPNVTLEAMGDKLFGNIGTITEALAAMTDADCDYIFKNSLAVVSRRSAGTKTWAKLLEPSSGRLMFENDLTLVEMYQIVWEVLRENLSGFFSNLGQFLPQSPGEPETSSG
jgi:hypothetical protein